MNRILSRMSPPLMLFIVLAGLTAVIYPLSPASAQRTIIVILINVVLVVGLYIFTGNSGIYSFGHLAFAMLGGYVGGLLAMPPDVKEVQVPDAPNIIAAVQLPAPLAVLVAGLVAALVAIPIAVPLSRIGGLAAGLATVAMLLSMNVIASEWTEVTRGRRSLSGIPVATTVTWVLVWVLVVLLIAAWHQKSRTGRQLRASREDEVAAAASGILTTWVRGQAFVLSAFVTGIGGALFGMLIGSMSPSVFYLDYTFLVIAMLVIGGARSLTGAVVGAVAIGIMQEVLRRLEGGALLGLEIPSRPGLANIVLGVVLIVTLLRLPQGLTNGQELRWPIRRTRAELEGSEPEAADTERVES